MEFFEQYEKKMTRNNIFLSVLFVLMGAGFFVGLVCFACNGGFSLEADYAIGFRGARTGIPVPNIVFLILLLGMTVLMIFCAINSIKNAVKNPVYNKFIAGVEKIAPAELVGEQLSAMSKSKLAKGDLRFDEKYFFYAVGDKIYLLWTRNIRNIRPVCQQGKYENYYVFISTDAEEIRIETTKKNYELLAEMIYKSVRESEKAMP